MLSPLAIAAAELVKLKGVNDPSTLRMKLLKAPVAPVLKPTACPRLLIPLTEVIHPDKHPDWTHWKCVTQAW